MSDRHESARGDGLEELEDFLRRSRSAPSPVKLDEVKRTVQARAHARRGRVGTVRERLVTSLLVVGLTFGGGGALVVARTADNHGGSGGNAATAQYGGPGSPGTPGAPGEGSAPGGGQPGGESEEAPAGNQQPGGGGGRGQETGGNGNGTRAQPLGSGEVAPAETTQAPAPRGEGGLPFTGLEMLLLVAAGLALVAMGLGLRKAAGRRSAG